MKLLWRFAFVILFAVFGVHAAVAQGYPSRPIRIVVPFPAGGSVDATARLISPKMADALTQPVLVENRAGASARIGEDAVAKAAPDGYMMLMDSSGITISPSLYRNLPFDPAKDFIPVTQIVSTINLLAASPKLPATSVKELIALAKSKPGGLNYGHTGVGTSLQMAMELFKLRADIDILGIPYKGDALVSNALMASEVDVAVLTLPTNLQFVKAGRLRALGVSSTRRSASLPDVPTVAEAGVAGYEYVSWYGIFLPAKTPRAVVELIHREAVKALNLPEVRDRILALGLEPVGGTPEEFDARFRADMAKYARLVKEARIPLQD